MRIAALALASALAACSSSGLQAPTPAWVNDTSSYGGSNATSPLAERYRDVAAKIIATARAT